MFYANLMRGGEGMDDDIYVFELFQQVLRSLDEDTSPGRMQILSKDPQYAADDPAKTNNRQKGENINGRETRTKIRP